MRIFCATDFEGRKINLEFKFSSTSPPSMSELFFQAVTAFNNYFAFHGSPFTFHIRSAAVYNESEERWETFRRSTVLFPDAQVYFFQVNLHETLKEIEPPVLAFPYLTGYQQRPRYGNKSVSHDQRRSLESAMSNAEAQNATEFAPSRVAAASRPPQPHQPLSSSFPSIDIPLLGETKSSLPSPNAMHRFITGVDHSPRVVPPPLPTPMKESGHGDDGEAQDAAIFRLPPNLLHAYWQVPFHYTPPNNSVRDDSAVLHSQFHQGEPGKREESPPCRGGEGENAKGLPASPPYPFSTPLLSFSSVPAGSFKRNLPDGGNFFSPPVEMRSPSRSESMPYYSSTLAISTGDREGSLLKEEREKFNYLMSLPVDEVRCRVRAESEELSRQLSSATRS